MAKRVAVIGAGVSGLSSIKCCLEEGLQPTCFEKSDDIGGLWRFTQKVVIIPKLPISEKPMSKPTETEVALEYLQGKEILLFHDMPPFDCISVIDQEADGKVTFNNRELGKEQVEDGRPSLYKSVVSNTCKEMSAFTDFPYPEDFPAFLSHSQVLEYLRMYAKHFDLLKHIQFKTTVISVRKCPDFSTTGQWTIVTESNGKQESSVFDAVMICIGYLSDPSLPLESFPGIEKFQGQYFHSRYYKHPDAFEGKKVLVVGMGNSGVDIAIEASRVAKKVMISTGQGAWVISRVFDSGYPWDMVFLTRFMNIVRNSLPAPITTWLVAHRMNQWFNHANYGLVPQNRIVIREPILNDELPGCIITGKISVKPSLKEIKENSVVFQNSPTEEPIDIIVFATGYKFSFPFLEESVVKVENKQASLYKYIFPPHLEKPTLAVIGLIKPFGAVMPVVEIQARWVTRVFKGLCQLPSVSTMVEEINEKKKNKIRWFGLSYDEVLKTDCLVYIDDLASLMGTKPNVLALLFQDPSLAMKIFFGPCTAYQYRLTGPGKWDGARNAILTQWDRTIKPMRTRVVEEPPNFYFNLLKIISLLALFAAIFLGFK